ncbi:MAG: DNA cytosine methyltransferase [Solirubrobacteraceae bacterium]|nr:DNA cytosine methyltransferase [Solirubrobacteraceae bacterium]
MSQPTVVSLYSGAGGLDLGFIAAGFQVVFANDVDPWAAASYRENIGDHMVCGDVLRTPLPDWSPDVLVGGPPCQGFSVIGKMRSDDPRSAHVFHFMDAVRTLEPRAFVMENVRALYDNPRWAPLRAELRRRAEEAGYTVELMLLNAADFGVPQTRERMFFVGTKGGEAPARPKPTTLDVPTTVRQALSGLPAFGQPGNDTSTGARVVPSKEPVMRPTAHTGSLLFNGSGRPLHLDRPAKTLPASMGGNATPIIDPVHRRGSSSTTAIS